MTSESTASALRRSSEHRAGANGRAPGHPPAPHDLGAERALLGCALVWPEAAAIVAERCPPEVFYGAAHVRWASAVAKLVTAGAYVDVSTVVSVLKESAPAVESDPVELLALVADAPPVKTALRHVEVIRKAHAGRQALLRLSLIGEAIRDGQDWGDLVSDLAAVANDGSDKAEVVFEDIAGSLDGDDDAPSILLRSDGAHLLYAGATNAFVAEPTSGKTTLAGMAVRQQLEAGAGVVYLDYEDTARRLLRRLVALGAPPLDLVERFHYARPGAVTDAGGAALARRVSELEVGLVVIDGVGEALAAQGLDEDRAGDIGRWWQLLPRRLAEGGAAVLLIDHVTKSKEGRGRWARGSGAKLANIDGAAYVVETLEPFSRTRSGSIKLTIAKDRPGVVGAVGDTAAIVHITPLDAGQRIDWRIGPSLFPPGNDDSDKGQVVSPALKDAILAVLEDLAGQGANSRRALIDQLRAREVRFRTESLGPALVQLVQGGLVVRHVGPNRSNLYELPPRQTSIEEASHAAI